METRPRDEGAARSAAVVAPKSIAVQRWPTETVAPDAETQARSIETRPTSMATERKSTETQAMAVETSASDVSIAGQSMESGRRALSIAGQSMAIAPRLLEIQRQTARIERRSAVLFLVFEALMNERSGFKTSCVGPRRSERRCQARRADEAINRRRSLLPHSQAAISHPLNTGRKTEAAWSAALRRSSHVGQPIHGVGPASRVHLRASPPMPCGTIPSPAASASVLMGASDSCRTRASLDERAGKFVHAPMVQLPMVADRGRGSRSRIAVADRGRGSQSRIAVAERFGQNSRPKRSARSEK